MVKEKPRMVAGKQGKEAKVPQEGKSIQGFWKGCSRKQNSTFTCCLYLWGIYLILFIYLVLFINGSDFGHELVEGTSEMN